MEINIKNNKFENVKTLDVYKSFIWTDRYYECGDFELYISINNSALPFLAEDSYLEIYGSEHLMVVEDFETTTDVEDGNYIIITGRSLESLLDRRVIWTHTVLKGNLVEGIKKLLNENAISPSDENRKIPNLIFKEPTDERITSLEVDTQFFGTSLMEAIASTCKSFDVGFKLTLSDSNELVFELYMGVDRSYDQTEVPYIEFSPSFDNILNTNFVQSTKSLKNIALVGGEGEGSNRKTVSVQRDKAIYSGLARREVFIDAMDISSYTTSGTLSDADYKNQLTQRGLDELANYTKTESFDGEVLSNGVYKYQEDYFMGDIVQLIDQNGKESKSRITEYIISESTSESTAYPTFTKVEDKMEEEVIVDGNT